MNTRDKAIAKITEGLVELFDHAIGTSTDVPEEPVKETGSRKKTGKKKAAKKKEPEVGGPSIDDVRKACMNLIEVVDEFGDEDDDGNKILIEFIEEIDGDAEGKLSGLEGNSEALAALMAKVTAFLQEEYPEEEDD